VYKKSVIKKKKLYKRGIIIKCVFKKRKEKEATYRIENNPSYIKYINKVFFKCQYLNIGKYKLMLFYLMKLSLIYS